jgi:alpha-glucosidase
MLVNRTPTTLLLALFALACPWMHAQAVDAQGHPWWKHAVFYELYPRSFADSDNNGTGDLPGIASKLDYLKGLGIDAIWITPFYPSPQVDFGYDVSDFENIDPMYGTLTDFDHLQTRANQQGIRIILDLVINHTSNQHAWFLDSSSSPTSTHRDWYIWRNGKSPGNPPNNWRSDFGGPAWTLDRASGQYYYHNFAPQQPDLNWRNPAVEAAMFDVTRFWYKRGVSGFRLDAVDYLFEDPELHDNPILPGKNERGEPNMQDKYNSKLPEVHDLLRSLRSVADQSSAVLVGETYTDDATELKKYYGARDDEIQLPMNFVFCTIDKLSAPEFRKQIAAAESTGEWPVYVIGNHDMPRSYVRYGDGKHNDQIAKLMAALYLTLRGTAVMYYGEELGMENNDPKRLEDVKDPAGKTGGWPENKGRDGERTPMQWNDSPNAGFTQGTPWLPVPPSYKTHNVATESADPNSILQFYRHLLALRHEDQALLEGDYVDLSPKNDAVLAYLRRSHSDDEAVLVLLNMSPSPQTLSLDVAAQGFSAAHMTTLLSTPNPPPRAGLRPFILQPFAVYIARLSR